MNTIRVLANTISKEEFEQILEYYNTYKTEDENPLERLDRTEGGFQIQLPSDKWKIDDYLGFADVNDKIRQLRWSNGRLVSGLYTGFTPKQYMLLYDALAYALPGNVILE